MLPKNYYDLVEQPGFLKHILYGDSVSKDMKSIIKFKASHMEYIKFCEIWDKLAENIPITTKNDKEYLFIKDEIEVASYDLKIDSWNLYKPQYLMRHKINDQIVRINFTNIASLDVTENHSMIDYDHNNKSFIIKNPMDMKYIPAILSDANVQLDEIDYKYLLLGLWFGDGTLSKPNKDNAFQYPAISSNNAIEMMNLLETNIENIKFYRKTNDWDFFINYKWLRDLLLYYKLDGIHSLNRVIPNELFIQLQNDPIKSISFILGYWLADGSFNNRAVIIASENRQLLEQIQYLLMIIGIYSHLKLDKNNRKFEGIIHGDMFKLSTSLNNSLINLFKNFEYLKDFPETVEFCSYYYGQNSANKNIETPNHQICRSSKRAHLFQLKPIKISSKEFIEYDDYVYDLCVPETQNFIANGCLVHNTDSLFISIPIKDSEKLTTQEKLKISDKVSEDINNAVTKYLNSYFLPKSNISPDQNATYFKSEMLMDAIMFLDVKKTYAYKLLASKGQIFDKPSIEYTGIQVVRSNAAKLTQDLLREIIENIILNEEVPVKEKLTRTTNIVNDFHQKFIECIENLDIIDICIPGKWSKADLFINGMTLYNFIMKKEIFSMGSAGYFIYCTFKNPKIFQDSKLDMTKVKGIVIPRAYDKILLDKKLEEYQINIDSQQQWDTLYSTTVNRIVNLIKSLK